MMSDNEKLMLAAAKAVEKMGKRNSRPLTKKSILSRLGRLPRRYVEWLVSGLTRCGKWPLKKGEIAAMNKKQLLMWVATVTGPGTILVMSFLTLFMGAMLALGAWGGISSTAGVIGAMAAFGVGAGGNLQIMRVPLSAAINKMNLLMPKTGKLARSLRIRSGCLIQIPLANMANKRARRQILERAG